MQNVLPGPNDKPEAVEAVYAEDEVVTAAAAAAAAAGPS
jgi:hypothetical protein